MLCKSCVFDEIVKKYSINLTLQIELAIQKL